ncbi:MAG: acyl-CoA dehydrogenase family protein [Candidatus Cloacimonadaceae bacterium]|jgi:alkylation response protein AidB-like acyl-CoA dehydrogenase|nr:acyl-CoA dehydrogenase family protein [Candidatus Cloacimonadota bacterium]MDY0128328.1 acyl-CoA dehydrogenase family protein [Candidatus Cloacimonadaceae bacterium]MCB5254251.1 acyl-CoA dehydrogenase family protein [Candidatus Cloacimonadota bacterium]MCK9178801.1 acyl-CoA dehydrogenase family protein [Candidatus Cloacimonadota bacterium]MCK9243326.1 acyl-CoA dehydrogenase family protein [Candidatus Cloacimonadota bacterium]
MNYFLTEDQLEMQELARRIANEKMKPLSEHYDQEGIFPWDIVEVMRQSDLFAILIPEEYDGISGKVVDLVVVTEELCAVDAGIALAFGATGLGMYPILIAGTEEQKQKYLPIIAAGEELAAFALTEANAGSDAGAIETTARKEGDYYILNGTKQWITNGGEAGIYTVFAMTDKSRGARGCSCFIVEKDTPGFSYGKKENKMGIRASATRELIFEDCKVPAANLLGREGTGFITAMKVFDKSRPMVGSQAVGIARGAFEASVRYSKERHQFGKPISSFQAIQFMLADMATEIEAARALVFQTAKMVDAGIKNYAKESAMCKYFASDMAMKVTTDAVQILGGYGYMKEYPVEKMMRDAKILQIYEGTNQIQRGIVASNILKEF